MWTSANSSLHRRDISSPAAVSPAEVTAAADLQNMARNSNRIHVFHLLNLGVPSSTFCAKYAAAVFVMSRSIRSLAFSARRRATSACRLLVSICSGVTLLARTIGSPRLQSARFYLPHLTAQIGLGDAQRLARLHLRLPALHQAYSLQSKFLRVCRSYLLCHHFLAPCLHLEQS